MAEFDIKQNRIQALLAERHLDALLLQRVSSFAWATCGAASHVNTAVTNGEASLLITPTGRHLLTNNIETTHLEEEEKLAEQGWQFHVASWYKAPDPLTRLASGLRLGADGPVPGAVDLSYNLARLRANLTPEEGERFRSLGRLCAEAIDRARAGYPPGPNAGPGLPAGHGSLSGQAYAWNPSIAGTKSGQLTRPANHAILQRPSVNGNGNGNGAISELPSSHTARSSRSA